MLTMLPGDRQHRTVLAAHFSALWKTRPLRLPFGLRARAGADQIHGFLR
jgi:hypothetical protein